MKARSASPREVLAPRPAAEREELVAIVYDEVVRHLLRGTRDGFAAQLQATGIARRVADRAFRTTKV